MCACPIIKRTSFSFFSEYARILAGSVSGMVAVVSKKEEKNHVYGKGSDLPSSL